MKIQLPEKVNKIITTLQAHGFEAYAVGGCVRDCVLGRVPQDWDITTSAMPMETKALFDKTFDTGIEHGTITVLLDKEGFEVTTYRIDGKYEDGRHPSEVLFTRNLQEDLLRRDFTINAMAYNDQDGLVDIFGGMEDLDRKIIRCVGNATERFNEDALRIMRAVRFSAQLGFEIEEETQAAIRMLAPNLQKISAERIQAELIKLLVSPHPDKLLLAWKLGITAQMLPEFDAMMETTQETPHHNLCVGEHTIKAMTQIAPDKVLRLTMLMHDMGKPAMKTVDENGRAHFKGHAVLSEKIAAQIMGRLKFDNDTLHKVRKLVYYHDHRMEATPRNIRHAMNRIGEDLFPYYNQIRRADTLAQSEYKRDEKLKNLEEVEAVYAEVLRNQECVTLKQLAITGKDLIAAGIPRGPVIGETLNLLLQEVLDDPEKNTREYLLKKVSVI